MRSPSCEAELAVLFVKVFFEKFSSLNHLETLLDVKLPRPDVVSLPAVDKLSLNSCVKEDSLNHFDDSTDQVDYIKAVSQVQELQNQGDLNDFSG